MATKRFSRLSIMLEAQDGMSRPLQNAARASQELQSRLGNLGNAFTRNGNSIRNASVQQRILSEQYQQLGQRIGGATNQVGMFARAFQSLPAPLRVFAYEVEGIAKAIYSFATQNRLAQASAKVLTTTFNGLRAAVSNVTWDIQRGSSALFNWFRGLEPIQQLSMGVRMLGTNIRNTVRDFFLVNELGQNLRIVGRGFIQAGQNVRLMGQYMSQSLKQSFGYQLMSHVISDLRGQIVLTSQALKTWVGDVPTIVRTSDAFRTMSISVEMVKQKLVAARLAFELWRNSSRTAETIGNALNRITSPLQRIWSGIQRNIQGLRNFNTTAEGTESRGRATFNQLADANARLNRQIQNLNSELSRSNSLLGKMKSGISSIASIQKIQFGANMAMNVGERIKQPIESMLNNAAQQDFGRKNFGIIVGDQQKGAEYYKAVQDFASTTQYAPTEWAQQLTSVMKKVQNKDQLNKYMYTMEQLATLMPQQGLEGAAFAMRELAGGQITSLANRFDISKQYLKPIKKETDPMKQAEMLSAMLGKEYGYSVENVQKMKQSPLMQFQAIKNHASNAMGQMGMGMLNKITPELTKFNKAFSAGKFNQTFKNISNGLGNAAAKAMEFGRKLITAVNSSAFKAKAKPIVDAIKQIADGLVKSWPSIKSTLSAAGGIISKFFAQFSAGKGSSISNVIQTIFSAISKLVNFINDHFNGVEALVGGLFAGLMAYKAAVFLTPFFKGLTMAIRLYRSGMLLAAAAQAIMNARLLLFPGTWIALAIAAVVAGGILLWKNWDTVSSGMKRAFAAIQRGAADMVNGVISGINFMIGGINKLIDLINKIPSVHLPKVPTIGKVSWGTAKNDGNTGGYDGAGTVNGAYMATHSHRTGLGRVPYDGYVAQLHKDERVLTAQAADDYDNGNKGVTVTGNTFIVRKESDIDSIADALFKKLYEAKHIMG
jgi:hypothetical protein